MLQEKTRLLVVGGDRRQLYMAKNLMEKGYAPRLCGFGRQADFAAPDFAQLDCCTLPPEEVLRDCRALLLPLPASRDGICVNAPFADAAPAFAPLLAALDAQQTVFGGMLPERWKAALSARGIAFYDYFEREEFALRNAVPTAQGVLRLAMENIEFTLHGAHCAVTGYGRCARVLCAALRGIGAKVLVAARSERDLAKAQADTLETTPLARLAEYAPRLDILVNTVPARVVDSGILRALRQDCLLIEIASGIDRAAAQSLGIRVIPAPSLPGKAAPKTAGNIIAGTVHGILKTLDNTQERDMQL